MLIIVGYLLCLIKLIFSDEVRKRLAADSGLLIVLISKLS